ncbi:MAG TPA: penicillin-insensitive murein endopeptidase [Paracoccaceae bacterium]|nr:penicillin-insensitive murein endopeptidase [Paracoccaceae bacterium]
MRFLPLLLVLALWTGTGTGAEAQSARALFSSQASPSSHQPHAIGRHARGCLAGGIRLPESGPGWQAMRLGRNRHWAHPKTLAFVERLSRQAIAAGWRGLYIGDISQPRGGPAPGHASHQTGLDVDIWMLPPSRLDLSRGERERLSSISVRSADGRSVNGNWTVAHHRILEAAARDPEVERIFVTGPVKLRMCADAGPRDRGWLAKIRPWWGHDTHFHVRMTCPAGQPGCVAPDPLPPGDGCAEAVWWVTEALEPPDPDAPPPPPRPELRLADLPPQCRTVLETP